MTGGAAAADLEQWAPSSTHAMGLDAATDLSGTLKALADPLRLRMLSAIATDPRGEACVCDLAELAEVSQPTVSHHLKKLKETGLLLSERRGTWVYYRISPDRRSAVTALLDSFAPTATGVGRNNQASHTDALRTMDARVAALADDLAEELAGINRELVVATVRESYTGLVRVATLPAHTIALTERFARQRLADLTRDRTVSVPQVLFVCVANAGRSQLAAALVNQLAGNRVIARSAGSSPAGAVHPHVRAALQQIDGAQHAGDAFPKPLTDDAIRAADVVITMGCGDVCPIIPGIHYEDWAVGDPALASPEGVTAIRDDIESRVRVLLSTLLPHEKE